jgi:hypothetical protein
MPKDYGLGDLHNNLMRNRQFRLAYYRLYPRYWLAGKLIYLGKLIKKLGYLVLGD